LVLPVRREAPAPKEFIYSPSPEILLYRVRLLWLRDIVSNGMHPFDLHILNADQLILASVNRTTDASIMAAAFSIRGLFR
ncbi:MAG: hypothetical protein P8P54_11550, partial [Pseudomonadales bacterium]|nr:hypothetical protein [Pseudomonadales bacterium]